MKMGCDDYKNCEVCPFNHPGGPCWEPSDEVMEEEYWSARCAQEALDREIEEEEADTLSVIDAETWAEIVVFDSWGHD